MTDHNFDDIAHKFKNNIYGTTKGRLRHELLLEYLSQYTPINSQQLNILDAGGGVGVMTKSLVGKGHQVTLNDLSEESLTIAKSQINNTNVQYLSGPIQSISLEKKYDLVICHAVLEWVKDANSLIHHLIKLTNYGGYLSISFFNRHALKFGNALYGNFDYVASNLARKKHVALNPKNALTPESVLSTLKSTPITVIHQAGIRCVHDYLFDREKQKSEFEHLKKIELELGPQHPYKWLGKYFHIIGMRDH